MNTYHRLWHPRLLVLVAIAALALFAAAPARAADTRGGENVVIGRGEVVEGDLYVSAKTLTVDGTIKGDLVAIAGQITVNGTVEGDILAAGQGVIVNGTVGDDMRAAGQAIVLAPGARVAGDVAVGALSLEAQPSSAVQGDVLAGAYQALLAGTVGRNVRGGMDRLELRGTVDGDVDVDVGGDQNTSAVRFSPAGQVPIPVVPASLTLGDSARVGGKLIYRSTTSGSVSPAAHVERGITFDQQQVTTQPAPAAVPGLNYARRLASLLLAGLLLLWLLPLWTRRMADSVEARPLPSLGWGLVAFFAFVAAVIAVLVLMVALAVLFGFLTLGGVVAMIVTLGLLASAAMVTGYVAFAAYVAQAIVGYMAGRWLLRRVQPAWAEQPIVPLALGIVLYVAVRAIPWLGGIVSLLVVLLALGALWEWGRATFRRPQATPTPVGGLQPA